MKITKTVLTGGLLVLMMAGGALAQDRVDARQARQHARIHEGVKSGDLTRPEAHKLRHEQRHIRRAERRAGADGVVTSREKAKLERMQDKASRDIYRQKHDKQVR